MTNPGCRAETLMYAASLKPEAFTVVSMHPVIPLSCSTHMAGAFKLSLQMSSDAGLCMRTWRLTFTGLRQDSQKGIEALSPPLSLAPEMACSRAAGAAGLAHDRHGQAKCAVHWSGAKHERRAERQGSLESHQWSQARAERPILVA